MSGDTRLSYVRPVDSAKRDDLDGDQPFSQNLLELASGAKNLAVSYVRTPSGGGSPEGLHTHEVDQFFYVLSGAMHIEVDGEFSTVGPDTLLIFPAGIPHRNWNEGPQPTIHLALKSPLPDPERPFARPVRND